MRIAPSLLVLCSIALPAGVSSQEPSIRDLGWLVGEWTFDDGQIEGEYRETGTRDCTWALGGDYIRCVSHGTDHRGREREYVWYFNYNADDARFEITNLIQGFQRKLLYTATLHDGGRRLEISYGTWEGDRVVADGGATVTYDGRDTWVWETARFRDVVTRR